MAHSFFTSASNFTINGGTFNSVGGDVANYEFQTTSDRMWMKLLLNNTASGAFHDSGERLDAAKCHPNTRDVVIREIMDWIEDTNAKEQFLWIYGPAGSGKSSIAQTIAEICDRKRILASNYFFARSIPGRNNASKLIPSLAYQLTVSTPQIVEYVAEAINFDNLIFSRRLQIQLKDLIMNPLSQLPWASDGEPNPGWPPPFPNLIIIDGLDECGPPESQGNIISALSSALQRSSVPLLILIASRPEQVIREEFNDEDLNSRTRRIVLDDKYHPDNDIRIFIASKFLHIKRKHPLAATLRLDWPTPSTVDWLVQKASGQFIYASTVMKFIGSPGHRPPERLDIILNLAPAGSNAPFADLDSVYERILLSIEKTKLEKVLSVFAFLFASSQMESMPFISSFTSSALQTSAFIELFLGYEQYDLLLVLGDLHSLVDAPPSPESSGLQEVRLFHPSLSDFLQDRGRSGPANLFIDMGLYSAYFARLCMRHLTPWLYSEDANFINSSATIQFSFRLFLHLFSTAHSDSNVLHDLAQFPIDLFIKHMFDGLFPVFSLIPLLFDWIKKQDTELYNVYIAHYASYIKSRLLSKPVCNHLRWQYIYTAVTLNIADSNDFSTVCKLFVPGSDPDSEEAITIQRHLFGELKFFIESLDISDYLSRLKTLLIDSSQSGKYCVDTSKYYELAMELFDMFTLQDKCPKILDDLHNKQGTVIELFFAVLFRIPGEPRLARHLRDNRHRDYISFAKQNERQLRSKVDMYIKNCSYSPEIPQEHRSHLPPMNVIPAPGVWAGTASSRIPPSSDSSRDEDAPQRSASYGYRPIAASNGPFISNFVQPSQAAGPSNQSTSSQRRGLRQRGKDFINKIIQ